MSDDFTILIQGPYKPNILLRSGHKNYTKFGSVLVSCYTGDDTSDLDQEKNITVVKNPMPDDSTISIPCVHPNRTLPNLPTTVKFYYHLYSIYHGVKNIKTKYVIKTRSDEFYEDLTMFLAEFLKNDNRVVCGNIYTRKWYDITHHMGDHLFVIKTEVLKKAVKKLLDMFTILPKDRSKQENAIREYAQKQSMLDEMTQRMDNEPHKVTERDAYTYHKLKESFDEIPCPCFSGMSDNPWGADTVATMEDWAMPTLWKREGVWHMSPETVLLKSIMLAMDIPYSKLNCRKTVNQHLKILDVVHTRNYITNSKGLTSALGYNKNIEDVSTQILEEMELFGEFNHPEASNKDTNKTSPVTQIDNIPWQATNPSSLPYNTIESSTENEQKQILS